MKKKKIAQIVTVAVATTVLTITAFASSGKTGGYEAVKDTLTSVKSMKQDMKNATVTFDVEVTDYGKTIASLDGTAKMDKENKAMSGAFDFTIGELSKSVAMYRNSESHMMVDKLNDTYYQMKKPEGMEDFPMKHGKGFGKGFGKGRGNRPEGPKTMTTQQEALLDFIVGDLKDNFTLKTEADGSQIISFSAKEQDIPVPVNLFISAMASAENPMDKKMNKMPMDMKNITLFTGMEEALGAMPRLKEDVKILSVNVDLTLDANDQLTGNVFDIQIAGKDATGTQHEVRVTGSVKITDVDKTVVDTIDVVGKEVQVIEMKKFHEFEIEE